MVVGFGGVVVVVVAAAAVAVVEPRDRFLYYKLSCLEYYLARSWAPSVVRSGPVDSGKRMACRRETCMPRAAGRKYFRPRDQRATSLSSMIALFQFVSSLVCLGPARRLVHVLEWQVVLTRC